MCTKEEEILTKMFSDILSENKCTKIVAGRLPFDLLTQSKNRHVAASFHLLLEYEVRSLFY